MEIRNAIDSIKEKIAIGCAAVNERVAGCLKRENLIECAGWLMQVCASHLGEVYQAKGFYVQKLSFEDNGSEGVLVQIGNPDDEWKKDAIQTICGQKLAVNVKFSVCGEDLQISIDNGRWLDKTFSGVVSWAVFAPLVLFPIVGAVRQCRLIGEIERDVLTFAKSRKNENCIDALI